MLRRLRKGQSTAEYAIVIGLVLAAVVGMQVYVKRWIQGKMKDASDADVKFVGDTDYGVNSVASGQYEPQYSITGEDGIKSTRDAKEKTTVSSGGKVERELIGDEKTSKTGTQETLAPPK